MFLSHKYFTRRNYINYKKKKALIMVSPSLTSLIIKDYSYDYKIQNLKKNYIIYFNIMDNIKV